MSALILFMFLNSYGGLTKPTYVHHNSNFSPLIFLYFRSYGGYDDELTEAATWMYRATGEVAYLTDAENHYTSMDNSYIWSYSWASKNVAANVSIFKYSISNKHLSELF